MASNKHEVRIALISPSHYDDKGYVIQWRQAWQAPNTVAVLNGILEDCSKREVLGPDIKIRAKVYYEVDEILPLKQIAAWVQEGALGSFVALAGVQTNEFPRGMDIAAFFRARDITVVVGGYHVSGCIAMLPELPVDLKAAVAAGVILFAGDAEDAIDILLRDLRQGTPKPIYNFLANLPGLEGQPLPSLPEEYVHQDTLWNVTIDAGRGCPFQCSFCSIINVQGRKSRYRSADDVEALVRRYHAKGINHFGITDDNFARNKNWEPILDRLIQLRRKERMKFTFTIQIDVLAYKIPRFAEKCRQAGASSVFIGMESINPSNLLDAKKRQNKIWEYREMFQLWRRLGMEVYVGYIIGFANDTPETVERDIRIIMEEMPLDLLRFAALTPLPGSEDHARLYKQGVALDPDMNKYDIEHVVVDHPTMTRAEWTALMKKAPKIYYTKEHIEKVLRRKSRLLRPGLVRTLIAFKGTQLIEGVMPEQGGWGRIKVRRQRRSGMPLENPLLFYSRRAVEILWAKIRWALVAREVQAIAKKVNKEVHSRKYVDRSLTPISDEESETEGSGLMETYGAEVARRRALSTKKVA